MKALCVVHYANFGGPHNEALRLLEPLRRRGWETIVAIPDEPGAAAERLREGGVQVETLPLGRLRASADPRELLRFVRDFPATTRVLEEAVERTGASIVRIGGLVNPHGAFAARHAGAAVVWQIVDSRAPAPLRRAAMPLVRRYADAVMFDGEALVGLHGGRDSLPVPAFVYTPPVDTGRFVPSPDRRHEVREQLGIPADAPVVGTVASVNPMKGLEHFLDAAAQVAVSRPETWFVVVGGAPETHRAYLERLRGRADDLALPNPVVFAGERADVERWYPAFDVHVISSLPRSEGTTTTAMEAQSCGVPVVATRVAAVAEVIADDVAGLLVPPERPDAIAGAVLRLLGDAALRARMGAAGRETAVARFDAERAADVYVQAYEAALAHAATRRGGARATWGGLRR
jgi:glycosyltransferase involved in cell wall biosynthesis